MKTNHYGGRPAASITPDQVTAIKMGQRALGISDEDYRATLWTRYQADSCKDLTKDQAHDLIEDYVARGFELIQPAAKTRKYNPSHPPLKLRGGGEAGGVKHPRPKGNNIIALATRDEIDKVNAVAALIEWRAENGLALFLEKRMGIKGGRVRTSADAYKAIEGLKKLFENGMKAKHGERWWDMSFPSRAIHEYIFLHRPRK
jgi:hypothetical protein